MHAWRSSVHTICYCFCYVRGSSPVTGLLLFLFSSFCLSLLLLLRSSSSSFIFRYFFSFFFPHQIYTQMCIVYTYILSCIRHVYQPIAYFIPHRKRMMVIKQRQCMKCKWRAKKKILFGTICVCGAPLHSIYSHDIYIYMLGFGPIVLLAYVFVCLSVCVCEWQRWNRGGLE